MNDVAPLLTRHKLTADDFFRIAETGIWDQHHRIELIDGELLDMAPVGQSHNAVVGMLNRILVVACGDLALVWPQNSIQINPRSVPQPDFLVLTPRSDFYAQGARPGPDEVLLVVEVSDSTLRYDRRIKLPLYARSKLPEFWIVDVQAGATDVYRGPTGNSYADHVSYKPGDRIALARAPEISIELNLILG